MSSRTRIIAVFVVGVVVGWYAHTQVNPQKHRPVLTAIARVIRNWWWVVPLVLDEGPPPTPEAGDGPPIVGADGYPIVQHGRSI